MVRKLLLFLLEKNSPNIYGYTGHTCKQSGIYRSGNEYIPLSKKETFPPAVDNGVKWMLVVKV